MPHPSPRTRPAGWRAPASQQLPQTRAMTLVEVMVASALFTALAIGLTAAYVQNYRMARIQTHRTQAISTAVGIMEQIRVEGHFDILTKYYEVDEPPPVTVRLIDPSNQLIEPTGYRSFEIPINVRDDETLSEDWADTEIEISPNPEAPKLPIRFWLTLRRDASETQPVYDVFQIVLIYQWKNPATSSDEWHTGNFRIAVPKLTVDADDASST